MKKVLVLVLSAALALGIVLPVLASESVDLDAVAKAQVQRLEAQKAYVDSLVEAGQVTAEQGELMKKNIDLRIEYINSDDFKANYQRTPFWGWGRRGGHMGRPMMGQMMGGFGPGGYGFCPGYGQAPFAAPVK